MKLRNFKVGDRIKVPIDEWGSWTFDHDGQLVAKGSYITALVLEVQEYTSVLGWTNVDDKVKFTKRDISYKPEHHALYPDLTHYIDLNNDVCCVEAPPVIEPMFGEIKQVEPEIPEAVATEPELPQEVATEHTLGTFAKWADTSETISLFEECKPVKKSNPMAFLFACTVAGAALSNFSRPKSNQVPSAKKGVGHANF